MVSHHETQLGYEDYGPGPPILFAGRLMLSCDLWEYQIPTFVERGFRCVSIDWRGHGRSDRPARGCDFDAVAADEAMLLEHLDLNDLTVVGHSMRWDRPKWLSDKAQAFFATPLGSSVSPYQLLFASQAQQLNADLLAFDGGRA